MSKSQSFPFVFPEGIPAFPGFNKDSFESVSKAYSDWLHNANRVQAEMIRFVGERFSKDLNLVSRFAACKQPDEFLRLQGEVMTELASDYMQEGARIFSLFGDASKQSLQSFTKAAGSKRSS
jgi:Phasin protein